LDPARINARRSPKPLRWRAAAFVRSIGIEVIPPPDSTFLPGLDVRYGVVLVDEARVAHLGDILHEAGHVAVSDPAERKRGGGSRGSAALFAAIGPCR
jgi:hypothetical protein